MGECKQKRVYPGSGDPNEKHERQNMRQIGHSHTKNANAKNENTQHPRGNNRSNIEDTFIAQNPDICIGKGDNNSQIQL